MEPSDYSPNLMDDQLMNTNGSNIADQSRTSTFPGSLLGGFQGKYPLLKYVHPVISSKIIYFCPNYNNFYNFDWEIEFFDLQI